VTASANSNEPDAAIANGVDSSVMLMAMPPKKNPATPISPFASDVRHRDRTAWLGRPRREDEL
jgi:hypothetical protein